MLKFHKSVTHTLKGEPPLLYLQGQPNAFEHPSSSCLDSVLANETGLPITLAVLHRAVGRRCGLDLQLVNMPGQVLNRAVLEGGEEVYVDVFNGRVLDEQGLRCVWGRERGGLKLWGCVGGQRGGVCGRLRWPAAGRGRPQVCGGRGRG